MSTEVREASRDLPGERDRADVGPRPGAVAGSRRSAARMAARDLRRHPWRTVLILLLVGLPVFAVAFGSVLIASTDLPSAAEQRERWLWGYDGYLAEGLFEQDSLQSPGDPHSVVGTRDAAVDLAALDAASAEWTVCPGGGSCSVREAVPAGTEATLLTSAPGTLDVPGTTLDVRVVVTDLADGRLVGEGGRLQLLDGALPGQGQVLASRGLLEELASANERAEARGLEPGPVDRVELRLPDGGSAGLAVSGTLLDRVDLYPDALALFRPMDLWEPVVYVQAGSAAAQTLAEGGFGAEADVTAYLSGAVPDDYSAYRAYNRAGYSVLFRPVAADPGPVGEAFEDSASGAYAWWLFLPLVLVGVLALAEAGLLAGAAFAVGARQQRRSTALLSVTGAEPVTLRQTMVFSGLWCGLVGTLGGAVVGVAGGLAVVWAAQARHVPVYGPHVPWWPVAAAVVLGLLCAVVAAWIPARAVAGQDAWAAIKGATGERRPVSRAVLMTGLVLVGFGLLTAAGAIGVGMLLPTVKALMAAVPWLALLLVGSALGLLVGVLMLLPGTVTGLARLAGRLPVALRMAARDAHRNRSRTVPVAAAVVAATAVGTAVLTATALGDVNQGGSYRFGSPTPDTGYLWVQDEAAIEQMLEQEAFYTEDGAAPSAEEVGVFTGGADGARDLLESATATPGAPRITGAWEAYHPRPSCAVQGASDCLELLPLYPESSACHLPVPEGATVEDRREAVDEAVLSMTRAEGAVCEVGGGTGGNELYADALSTLMVVDPVRPQTMPLPLLGGDEGLVQALESGRAVVFDPEYLDDAGRFTMGEFTTDVDQVPGLRWGEDELAWREQLEADGDPLAGQRGMSPAQGRNMMWEPEQVLTLDAVRARDVEGDQPIAIIPISALAGTDQSMALDGVLARFAEPVTRDQMTLLNDILTGEDLWISSMAQGEGDRFPVQWLITGLVALLVVSVAGLTTGLALADARRDQAVLSSVGAPPGTRKSMAAAQTFTGALLGTVLGVPVGAIAVMGIGLIQFYSAEWIPWTQLAVLVLGVPLLAAAVTWLVVPGRLPVREADRG